jgi:5'-nucleotidase
MSIPETSLTIAIASRALFDLEESHRVFEEKGLDAYARYQIEREDEILGPGIAFPLVRKLLALNGTLPDGPHIEVILLSRNSADTGLRIFNSIAHHDLDISRAAFTNGAQPHLYVEPFGASLFLSAESPDVRAALEAGYAAASIVPSAARSDDDPQIRIAFDGDSVLFSDEAERVYKRDGLEAFQASEREAAHRPLDPGPFKSFLEGLQAIQAASEADRSLVRTALVTARSAPAHERVVRTLRHWGVRVDEALFLGGKDKGAFLKAFRADFFFDDQQVHCVSAAREVATGHVPHGIANLPD